MSSFIEFIMVLQGAKKMTVDITYPNGYGYINSQLIKLTVFLLIHLFNVDHIMSTYEKGYIE